MAQNNNNPATQDLNEIVKVRHEKLAALKESGNDPFLITKFDFETILLILRQTSTNSRAKPLKLQAESLPAELWVRQAL